jgi:hypothetical protein
MDAINNYVQDVEKKLPPIEAKITAERKYILDLIEGIKFEEN